MGKWSKLVEFWTRKLFQIRACVISARKAKHLDATTMFTYSHANIPLGQSERAYYLSNFIKCNIILNGMSLEESFHISGTVVDSDWCFENNQSWKWWWSPRCVKTSVAVNNSPTQDCSVHSPSKSFPLSWNIIDYKPITSHKLHMNFSVCHHLQ